MRRDIDSVVAVAGFPIPLRTESKNPGVGVDKVFADSEVRVVAPTVLAFDERKRAELRGAEVVRAKGIEE